MRDSRNFKAGVKDSLWIVAECGVIILGGMAILGAVMFVGIAGYAGLKAFAGMMLGGC